MEYWKLLIFLIIQLLNVTVSTIKYIVTVKSKPSIASIVNAISYTIGNIITIMIVKLNPTIAIIITFFSNLIGVPIGRFIVDKFTKDKLWIYDATIKCDFYYIRWLKDSFKDYNIHCLFEEISKDEMYTFKVFSESKDDSRKIKDILNKITNCRYHIIESR